MVTIFSALAEGTGILKENNIENPRLDAEVILSFTLDLSRLSLVTQRDKTVDEGQYNRYMELINNRIMGMPVSYLTGRKEFMGLDFIVTPGVLIPRGDTEIAVEVLLGECSELEGRISIADVGCGSGAIGISAAKYAHNAFVTLIDISEKALEVSYINASKNGAQDRVRIIKGDLLSPVLKDEFDIVVSNPPYIETGVIPSLQREVKDYEPITALDGGEDGLDFYRRITVQAAECLKPGGTLIYEIGYNQAQSVRDILSQNNFKDIEVLKDLSGLDRCVKGRKGGI